MNDLKNEKMMKNHMTIYIGQKQKSLS